LDVLDGHNDRTGGWVTRNSREGTKDWHISRTDVVGSRGHQSRVQDGASCLSGRQANIDRGREGVSRGRSAERGVYGGDRITRDGGRLLDGETDNLGARWKHEEPLSCRRRC